MNRDVEALFSRAAGTYDFLNRLFSLKADGRWRRELVRCAKIRPGDRILDCCTGTADLALSMAGRAEGVRVIGIDYSERMLALGREKVLRSGLSDCIELLYADAVNPPFPDGSFRLVTVAFGLRNLYDRAKGIREAFRVLEPGGEYLVLEFSPPPDGFFGRLYAWYLGRVMPAVGGFVSGSKATYRYLDSSIRTFMKPGEVEAAMKKAGFVDVEQRALTFGIAYLHTGRKPQA